MKFQKKDIGKDPKDSEKRTALYVPTARLPMRNNGAKFKSHLP